MRLNIFYDDIHRLHSDPYRGHPENPSRLGRALSSLRSSLVWGSISIYGLPEPEVSLLYKIHDREYVEMIERESRAGFHYLDADTYISEHTFSISARFATAAYISAKKSLERGELWMIMPRPGGHHAGRRGWAMEAPTLGFCIFNYAAMAAQTLLEEGLKVLMIDFDAHHGNGTQDIFWEEPGVVHIDIHEEDIYPGTGRVDDIGGGSAVGTKINIPLPPYSGDPEYLWIINKVLKPLIEAFKPEAIVVSAGFDAYWGDPLTRLEVTEETYGAIADLLRSLWIEKRIRALVTNLEGGYGEGLEKGLRAYIETLLGIREYEKRGNMSPPHERTLKPLRTLVNRYWGIEI
jgi:acetoin utilization deacetylase AcuC-like enzyme